MTTGQELHADLDRTSDLERRLAGWLAGPLGDVEDVRVQVLSRPLSTGFSSDTVLFDAQWRRAGSEERGAYAARVQPEGESLYVEHDLEAQWRVMEAVRRHSDVPVPPVIGHDTGPGAVLGRPFFVMHRIEGQAPADNPPFTTGGWVMEASATQQRTMHRTGIEVLARIHAVDWRGADLGFLLTSTANPAGLAAALDHDAAFLAWVANGRAMPPFIQALAWMADHQPAVDELTLSWGDARLGNILFAGFTPVAVLDWEMATLAAPEADLAWWLVFDRLHTDGIRRPRPPGFLTEPEAIGWYEESSGRTVTDLRYYEVRAAFRAGLLLVRYTDILIRKGLLPADARRGPSTPAINVLTDLLER